MIAARPVDVLLMTTNFGLELLQEPYGIGILSAILRRAGYETMMLEPAVAALSWEQCYAVIAEQRPRMLGISMLFDGTLDAVVALVTEVRRKLPGTIVFVGGQAPTTRYASAAFEPLLRLCDAFLLGEAETNIVEYVGRSFAGGAKHDVPGLAYRSADGELVVTAPAKRVEELDQIPMQDRSVLRQIMLRRPGYSSAAVQAGRGCASSCSFCNYGTLRRIQGAQTKMRRKSFPAIFAEIEHLFHEYGVRDFHIEDESFFEDDPAYCRELVGFAERIAALPEPVTFDVLARIDCVDVEATRALKAAGMTRIFCGIDSVDPDDLKLFVKGYEPAAVHIGMERLLGLGYSVEVDAAYRLQTGYITWHPYSTLERIRNGLEFFKRYGNTPKLIQHYLMVFSGTPLKKKIEADGLLRQRDDDVESNRPNFAFLHPEVGWLFEAMIRYFTAWSPFRDGIRMLEKVVKLELPAARPEISELIELRRRCDAHFYDAFEEMLVAAEAGAGAAETAAISERRIGEVSDLASSAARNKIAAFCRDHGLGGDVVARIAEDALTLARYKL